jgi:hypothetical protein
MEKIIFTDLDGTLLDDKKEISQENRQAIEKLTSLGHKIVLTTGRALPSAYNQAEKLSLTFDGCYLIAFNGGEIYDTFRKKTLYKRRLPIDCVLRIFKMSEEAGIHAQTYDDHYVLSKTSNAALDRYCREIVCEAKIVDDIAAALAEEPSKVLLLDYENHDKLEDMRIKLLEQEGDIIDAFFSSPGLLEVVLKGTNKGVAVEKLCEILNIPLENSVAAGDGMNDIPMLVSAHVGAAMKNAADEVKANADYITEKTNNESGFAEIIEKFVLE